MSAQNQPTFAGSEPLLDRRIFAGFSWLAAAIVAVSVVVSAGCGPVTTASTISDAMRDLDEANSVDAKRRAPYEYTRAHELLAKAKELEGHGMFESASGYARQSRMMSEKAIDVARLAAEREKRDERFGPKKSTDDSGSRDDPAAAPTGEGR
jgi:hypothetical protein